MPEARATLRYSGTAPSKVRQVLDLVRGLDVETARRTLRFSERGAVVEVMKLLDSAIANAEHNASIPADELFVSRAYADEGPTLRRFRPRARGRATRIRKRTSHITIVVARYSDDELQERRRRGPAGGTADRRRRLARRREAAREAREQQAHDHDHDDEQDHDEESEAAPAEAGNGSGDPAAGEGAPDAAVEAEPDGPAEAAAGDDDGADRGEGADDDGERAE